MTAGFGGLGRNQSAHCDDPPKALSPQYFPFALPGYFQ